MLKITRLALVAALLGSSSLAFAVTESATINVNATVQGVCKLTSTAVVNLAITANPSLGGDAFQTAPVRFKCTKYKGYTFSVAFGTAAAVSGGTLDASLSDGATPTANLLPFTATWTQPSGTGDGFSTEVNADVKVTISEANYTNAPAGTYTGVLKVAIDY